MPLSRDSLDRQLSQAQAELNAWIKSLDQKGVAAAARRNDPKWRSLNSKCRRLRKRLAVIRQIDARDAEAERRKTEPAAAED